jgi:anti-sigma28 factor (negative regulator of flagellin synthesis)
MAGEEKVMRIDLGSNLLPAEGTVTARTGPRSAEGKSVNGSGDDSAQVSVNRFSATDLTDAALQLPEVRQEKVAALSAQMHAGSYQVRPTQTAEAILSQMQAA